MMDHIIMGVCMAIGVSITLEYLRTVYACGYIAGEESQLKRNLKHDGNVILVPQFAKAETKEVENERPESK